MKIAASMSVGRLAPKHSLNIDGIRAISKNVTPKLIKNDVILINRLSGQDGKHMTIEEYTDQHFQPVIDQYNAKQRRKDRQIQTGYCEWHRGNGVLSQGKGELAYEAVLQYGTHEDIGGEYYSLNTSAERKAKLQEEFEAVYREWVEAIQRDYPHLTILYAVIHFSEVEGTPHLHVGFQPEADCTRGLAKQVSIGRALAQDGIERIDTRAEAEQAGGFQPVHFSGQEEMWVGSWKELQSAEIGRFQTSPDLSPGKRECNPRGIAVFWDDLVHVALPESPMSQRSNAFGGTYYDKTDSWFLQHGYQHRGANLQQWLCSRH